MRKLRMACTGGVALALLLTLAAPVAAQEMEEAEPAQAAQVWSATGAVPIEGTLVGEDWNDFEATDCDPGASWRFHSAGTGQIEGVGDVDFVLTHCTVWDPEAGTATFGDGTITFTTAEGDTLVIAQAGHAGGVPGAEPGSLIGWTLGAVWDVVDGSGQFEGATGHGWIGGLGDIGQNTPGALYGFRGNIEYATAE